MAPPQGFIHYTGIPPEKVISGGITLTAGATPNVATITCAPFPGPYKLRGVLSFRYGGVKIAMNDCRLTDISFQTGEDGKQLMLLHVADPRWAWQFGRIRGVYNHRENDNQIRPTREKKPQELAKMLFEAMGVTNYSLSNLPNNTRPSVDWDGSPVEALTNLCDSLGCRVIFNPMQNRAEIVVVGHGANLPQSLDVLSDSLDMDPPEVPDSIVFLAGKTEYQWDFELEPVGTELNGDIKKIDDLSFKPAGGWERSAGPPWFDDVAEKYRDIARQNVFRMYRIKVPVKVHGIDVDSLDLILPILDRLVQTKGVGNKASEHWPPVAYGVFYDGEFGLNPAKPMRGLDGRLYQWFTKGFSVDVDHGIVLLNEYAYVHKDAAGNYVNGNADPLAIRIHPASIYLRTTVNIRDSKSWAWNRHKVERKPGGKKLSVKPKYLARDDVTRTIYHHFDGANLALRDNENDVKTQADYYIDQELATWQLQSPGTRMYAGLKPIAIDGAISQVSWSIDDSGRTTTTISRHQEPPSVSLTYKQKQRQIVLNEIIRREAMR